MAYSKFRLISLLGILAVVVAFLAPALPKSIHAQDSASEKIESDDGRVMQGGRWLSQAVPFASGGNYLYNNGEATLTLNFAGPSLEVIYVAGPTLGTLAIEVDGTVLRTVITTDTETRYGQVAKIDYLKDEAHELKVYAQGGGVVAVDAFVVALATESEVAAIEPNVVDPCDTTGRLHIVNLVNGTPNVSPNESSRDPDVSGDGRYVVFVSLASNLVAGDTNGHADIFVHDHANCSTRRVSLVDGGIAQANGVSSTPFISNDGRYVGFTSAASNLVSDDTNGLTDIFIHDLETQVTTRVSVSSAGTQGDGAAEQGDISGNGRYIIFVSAASNLVAGDTNGLPDIFVHDRVTGVTSRENVSTSGEQASTDGGRSPAISGDGRIIAFSSADTTLVPGNNPVCSGGTCAEIFVRDRQAGTTQRISVSNTGAAATGGVTGSLTPAISDNGRYVAYKSDRNNLVGLPPSGGCPVSFIPCHNLFLFDRYYEQTTHIFIPALGRIDNPHLSADGRLISYDVVDVPYDITRNVYVFDRTSNQIRLISMTADFTPLIHAAAHFNAISADGRVIVFHSNGSFGSTTDHIYATAWHSTPPPPRDSLAFFRAISFDVSLLSLMVDQAPPTYFNTYVANSPQDSISGQWVMGDWDGDGDQTPGVYASNGVFYYTDEVTPSAIWSAVWIGLLGRPPVAGRFDAAVNHDCIGAVDSAEFPPYGTAFALYFTCDLTPDTAPALSFQWLSVVLPTSGGFGGDHQFATGDFDNNGVDSIAIRRGEFIAFGNVPPTTLLSEFTLAQYWGTPPDTYFYYGTFVVGDFDHVAGDNFGVFYENGYFYYRDSLAWNPGAHLLLRIWPPIANPIQVTAWH